MGKRMLTAAALLLTAALIWLIPLGKEREKGAEKRTGTMLVWVTEKESAVTFWLKKQAAAFEKAAGKRVYLRKAEKQEAQDALAHRPSAVIPDLLIGPEGEEKAALRGYALFLRDDAAAALTPAPTSPLFSRPTPSPGPSKPRPTLPPWEEMGAVLVPAEGEWAVPGAIKSADPPGDFSRGKARAALLTGGQAARLTVGYRAYPLPEGKGLLPVLARAFSQDGQAFLAFLREKEAQRALMDFGLYALKERLYPPQDPVRFLIDESRADGE